MAKWGVGDCGYFVNSNIMDLELKEEGEDVTKDWKFDTIIKNGALASVDAVHELDLVLKVGLVGKSVEENTFRPRRYKLQLIHVAGRL